VDDGISRAAGNGDRFHESLEHSFGGNLKQRAVLEAAAAGVSPT
jgi:methyl coenzyme M reductase alpha subunit